MRILSIGLFLLWGACSTNPDSSSAPENFGGDINSAEGKAWDATLRDGSALKSIEQGNGLDNWVAGSPTLILKASGNIENFDVVGLDSEFAGALSATRAFYWAPRDTSGGAVVQEAKTKLEGFFVSNVTKNNPTQTFIYPAALKFTEAELDAKRAQYGITGTVDAASLAQKRAYYADVHKPSNFDFTKPVITGVGEFAEAQPRAIIVK